MTEHFGHPFFAQQSVEETQLHDAKNHDYTAGGHPLGNFQRVATILCLYPGLDLSNPVVVALVYALKQWDAVLWGLSNGIQHRVEGLHPRLQDVSIYAKLARCILMDQETSARSVDTGPYPQAASDDPF